MSLLAASRRTAAAGLSRALAANRGVLAAADGASRSVVTMGRTEDTILPVSFCGPPKPYPSSVEQESRVSLKMWVRFVISMRFPNTICLFLCSLPISRVVVVFGCVVCLVVWCCALCRGRTADFLGRHLREVVKNFLHDGDLERFHPLLRGRHEAQGDHQLPL